MGKVMFGLSVSLDGFIADKNDDVSEVFAWFASAWDRFYEVAGDPVNDAGAAALTSRLPWPSVTSAETWPAPGSGGVR